jgi:predicted nuclease with TOPRIM domain
VWALIQDTNYYTSLKPYNKEEQIEKDIKNIKAYLQERWRTERFVNTPIVEERLNELKSRLLPIQAELARLESEFFRLEGELKLLVSCFSDEQKSRLISPDGDLLSSNLRVSSSGMEREINGIYWILIKNYNRSLELRNEKDKIIKDFKDDMWWL